MRRVAALTIALVGALAATAAPASACEEHPYDGDWACVYVTEAGVGYCQQNPVPEVDAPPEAELLPEVPDLAPIVEQYVVPLIPAGRL
ncbi:MAG TPA: hypothetical protein VHF47_05620 [Acidimicrobiales bacterium]|nr:hypothetical protein [Acidimicrobiales bacterium]